MKPNDKTIILTIAEICDLARAANLISHSLKVCDEESDTEYTIVERDGGIEILDDDETPRKYAHGAFLTEYREEGTFALGEEISSKPHEP